MSKSKQPHVGERQWMQQDLTREEQLLWQRAEKLEVRGKEGD